MQDLETSTEEMQGSVARNPRQSLNEELSKLPRDLKKNSKDPAEENSAEFKQQPSGGSSNKRKRSRPRKLVVLGSEASVGAKHHNRAGHVEELVAKACSTNEVALLGQGGEETAGTGVCSLDIISNLLLRNLLSSSSVAEAADQSSEI